ncbi:heparan-alpha-glucosaminide N-acetyltransferase domain-containing protein [uncultured Bifidobacterium sp.]|uniref:heparan-alpha-glucosaminide N-acetyltransferase domain-containing protein n=1 Tax=uncultured Bifidobacterium sp. TaxID=165187 RepID=UPI002597DB5D|nr:heparan-alpha-glucosaminide N-acetyltransferase domain-containing protein [uncultured Bifidobacterium sp.]
MPTHEGRYDLIDTIRGIAIVSMVIFHCCYDIFMVYGRDPSWYSQPAVHVWQQSICWTFILVSGFVWPWGRSGNVKRGIMLNVWGLVISGVTVLLMPAQVVWFGILNCIGCAVLLMIALEPVLKRIPAAIGALAAFALFMVFRNAQLGYLEWPGVFRLGLPAWLYDCHVLTPFGFPFPGFRSSDYFPILPWLFLYICGYFLNRIVMAIRPLQSVARYGVAPLSAIGRYSIWIYLVHQPVCMLACELLLGSA